MKTIKEISIKAKRLPLAKEDQEVYSASIQTPEAAAIAARTLIGEVDEERFVAIPLDVRNRPLGAQLVSKGSPDTCSVDPRCVFRAAIVMGASAVIVAHNHPSGFATSSAEDLALTKRLVKAGEILGLPLLDHLILTDSGHLSLRESHGSLFEG